MTEKAGMSEKMEKRLPFRSFSFTLVENRRPRMSFRLVAPADGGGLYDLSVLKGPATNPSVQVQRKVPEATAERLRDALQRIGAFGWSESYGDVSVPGSRRWAMQLVFEEGVFSLESRGGSDAPAGFDELLEELYRLDFPRPGGDGARSAQAENIGGALGALGLGRFGSVGGLSAGDIGAYASSGAGGVGDVDFGKIAELFPGGGMGGFLADAQRDPQALQRRMKDEFCHLSPDEQNRLIDSLAALGMGTREFWQRFFRG